MVPPNARKEGKVIMRFIDSSGQTHFCVQERR